MSSLNKVNPTNILRKSDQTIQIFRGMAIIAVVYIHALSSAGKWVTPDQERLFILARQVVNFAVPLFLFLAGYFTAKYEFRNLKDCWDFYQKRLSRLLVPYIFWSCFGILFFHLLHGLTIKGLFRIFLTGQAAAPFYFFIVLFQLIILTPILKMCIRNKFLIWLPVVLNTVSLVFLYVFNCKHPAGIKFPYYALPFSMWVTFYYWGMVAKEQLDDNFFSRKIFWSLSGVFTLLLFAVFEGDRIIAWIGNKSFAASQIKFSSFFYSFFMINSLMGIRALKPDLKVFAILGNYSFGIFLVHIFFLHYFSRWIERLTTHWFLVSFFSATAVLCACLLFIYVVRKLVGEKISSQLLGF